MRQRLYGGDHPDTSDSLISLAIDLRQMGEHERAREQEEQAPRRCASGSARGSNRVQPHAPPPTPIRQDRHETTERGVLSSPR
jgi:hypothetical protein